MAEQAQSTPSTDYWWLKTPTEGGRWMQFYSWWLKIEFAVFFTLPFLTYFVKWGLAWHEVGPPGKLTDTHSSSYWNMCVFSAPTSFTTAS